MRPAHLERVLPLVGAQVPQIVAQHLGAPRFLHLRVLRLRRKVAASGRVVWAPWHVPMRVAATVLQQRITNAEHKGRRARPS